MDRLGENTQPWQFVVLSDRELLMHLAALGRYAGHLGGARLTVVLVMDTPEQAVDAGRLAQSIMRPALARPGLGMTTFWIRHNNNSS